MAYGAPTGRAAFFAVARLHKRGGPPLFMDGYGGLQISCIGCGARGSAPCHRSPDL